MGAATSNPFSLRQRSMRIGWLLIAYISTLYASPRSLAFVSPASKRIYFRSTAESCYWQKRQRPHSASSLKLSSSLQDHELQEALRISRERSLDRFMDTDVPRWVIDIDDDNDATSTNSESPTGTASLPFSCTGCGNCCRTHGDVYLAPEDIREAAHIRNTSLLEFVQTYVSHYLIVPSRGRPSTKPLPLPDLLDDNKVWARLMGGETASCIFLDETTNQCQIYHARPAQCRTYPFWPNILQTPELWNAECRRAGGDDSDETIVDGGISSLLPFWSAEEGGCEAMKLLPSKDEKAVATTDTTDPVEDAVPIREACSQLMDYVLADSRFPQSAEEIPIEAIGESSGNHNE